MCHTIAMKKSVLFVLPFVTLLTSCAVFSVGKVDEVHSAGIENSDYSHTNYKDSYSYYNGDTIDETNENVANITFTASKTDFDIAVADITPLVNCDVANIFKEATDSSLTNLTENVGLYIGTDSTLRDGFLTLSFEVAIKDIKIEACSYYWITNAYNQDKFNYDADVAIAVNDSQYVKLSSMKDEENNAIQTTNCRYHLADDTKEIKIKVGPMRAYIKKIVLYY